MALENNLLGRCTVAYAEAWNHWVETSRPAGEIEWPDRAQRAGVAAVLRHLAAELVVLSQENAGKISAFEAANLIYRQAGEDTPEPSARNK